MNTHATGTNDWLWEAHWYRAPLQAHALHGPVIEKAPDMPRLYSETRDNNVGAIIQILHGRDDTFPRSSSETRVQLSKQIQHGGFGCLKIVGNPAASDGKSSSAKIAVVLGAQSDEDGTRLRGNLLKWARERGQQAVLFKTYGNDFVEILGLDASGAARTVATIPWQAQLLGIAFTTLVQANSL